MLRASALCFREKCSLSFGIGFGKVLPAVEVVRFKIGTWLRKRPKE